MPKVIDIGIILPPLKSKKGLFTIAVEVCKEMKVPFAKFRSSSKVQTYVNARKEFATRAYFIHKYKMGEIGSFLGHQDHSTISHYLKHLDHD